MILSDGKTAFSGWVKASYSIYQCGAKFQEIAWYIFGDITIQVHTTIEQLYHLYLSA